MGPSLAAAQGIADSSVQRLLRQRVDSGRNPAIVAGILEHGRVRVIAYGKSGAPDGSIARTSGWTANRRAVILLTNAANGVNDIGRQILTEAARR